MTPTFHIINLGCKVNRVEADSMAARLCASGANRSTLQQAEVVLINTCTVTGEADSKSRKALRRALREAPDATVIVCGCGATASAEQFEAIDGNFLLIDDKDVAVGRAGELLGLTFGELGQTLPRIGETFNTRVALKIQDGCDNSCSYCIVPLARGSARSVPADQVIEEITAHIQRGTRELVLTGIDLGSYQEGNLTLASLITRILESGASFRLRLSSLELPSITDELISVISSSEGRVCAHLHIPLQSGSDRILKAMNRRYDAEMFLSRLRYIKQTLPRLALSTDVIVGFPGETDEDFRETLEVCREAGFSRIHSFRYSKRPDTQAAQMPNQTAPEDLAKRSGQLRDLAEQLMLQDALARIGMEELVLFETVRRGRSESYYPVRPARNNKRGNLVTMRITGYEQGELIAEEC